MRGWIATLEEGQRRVLVALASLVAALGLAVGVVALTDDDPSEATVQTDGAVTSSTSASSTTATSAASSTTTSTTGASSSTTSTTKVHGRAGAAGATTTTIRRGGGSATTTKGTTTTRPTTTQPTDAPSDDEPCARGSGAAGQISRLFCDHRAGAGLPSMVRNAQLDAMAQEWAQKMAADGKLSHRDGTEARQMVAARCPCPGWAENVAFDASAQEAWTAWLGSATHRANIDDGRDGEYGIGVTSAGGYLWFVQVFGYYQ